MEALAKQSTDRVGYSRQCHTERLKLHRAYTENEHFHKIKLFKSCVLAILTNSWTIGMYRSKAESIGHEMRSAKLTHAESMRETNKYEWQTINIIA